MEEKHKFIMSKGWLLMHGGTETGGNACPGKHIQRVKSPNQSVQRQRKATFPPKVLDNA